MIKTTIHLDGELDTTPDETFAQARRRIIDVDNENNLCEMVGYYGFDRCGCLYVETSEARCSLLYNVDGKLVKALVNNRAVWQRA